MKKFLLMFSAIALYSTLVFSQTFEWGLFSNSTPKMRGTDINKNGNSFILGIVQNGLGIDTSSYTGGSDYDAFVACINSNGHSQFLKKAVYDVAANQSVLNNIASDNNNNFFLTFNVPNNPVPFYVGDDTIQKDTATSRVLFAKYDFSGNLLWSKQYKPVSPSANPSHTFMVPTDERSSIVVDDSGCVYIYATLNGYTDVIIDTATINWSGNYIFKFSPDGDMIYYKKITKLIYNVMECDNQNNLLVLGTVTGVANPTYNTLDFGNNVTLSFPTLTTTQFEFVLVKFDPDGVAQWAEITSSNYSTAAVNNVPKTVVYMSIDKYNAPYLTGYYNTQIVFFDDTLNGVSASYERNPFIVKFNANGDYQWAKTYIDTTSNQDGAQIRQLRFDSNNNIYLFCNYIQKGFNFFGNLMPKNSSSGSSDRMVAKLDTSFNLLWWKYLVGGEINNALAEMNVSDNDDLYIVSGGTTGSKITTLTLQSGYWWPTEDSISAGAIGGIPYIVKFGPGTVVGVDNSLYVNDAQILYPNPANSKIFFTDASENIKSLEIMNVCGQIIIKENRSDISEGIDVSHLKTGIYFVKKHTYNNVKLYKFIKQ